MTSLGISSRLTDNGQPADQLRFAKKSSKIVCASYLTIAICLLSGGANAQVGPQPGSNPFLPVAGGIGYPFGCVLIPSSVAGGCKGVGTLNVDQLYIQGARVLFDPAVQAAMANPPNAAGGLLTYSITVPVPIGGTGRTTFTANVPLIGNGTSSLAQGSRSGNTTTFATSSGTLTNGHCVSIDANGNLVDAGGACTTGGGGGTVSSGSSGNLAVYPSTGTTVSGLANGTGSQVLIGGSSPSWGSVNLSTMASGALQAAQFPALTGDVTSVAGALATTIASSAVTAAKIASNAVTTVKIAAAAVTAAKLAGGAAAANFGFISASDATYNVKCDGSTDDTVGLNAFLAAAASNKTLVLPPGNCMFSSKLTGLAVSHYNLMGSGPTATNLIYMGASTTTELMEFGNSGSSSWSGFNMSNINITSNTTMTGGYALHFHNIASSVFMNVWADAWNTNTNTLNLCGGYWFDGAFGIDFINPNTSSSQACGDGMLVNGRAGFDSAELRLVGGNIGGSPGGFNTGLHAAGGFGGLRCDGTNIAANTYGLIVDNAVYAAANREVDQGSTCAFDNSVVADVYINDTLADGGSGGAGGTIDLAGWVASTTQGHGIWIKHWKNSDVEIRGDKVYNNCGSGIYIEDTTTRVNISSATAINNNGNPGVSASCPAWQASNPGHGYGIEATAATNLVFGFPPMWSNSAGPFNANAGISLRLPQWTVGTLPSCTLSNYGMMVAVNDASAPTYNGALTGGGAVRVPAFCDGSGTWKSH